jgi:hypothetical protein
LEQADRELRFGAEGEIAGQTDLLTQRRQLLAKPVLGNEQLAADQSVALAGGIADKHADLRGTDFAKRATVLMGDTSGVLALFGHARFIDEEHAVVGVGKRVSDKALVLSENGSTGPGALSNEGLQLTNRDAQGQRDWLTRFARQGREQALEVTMCPSELVGTSKGGLELLKIVLQGREQGLDIDHGQVALGQRAGRCYNGAVHGLLPQSR